MKEELNYYIQMRPERQLPRFPMPELDEVDWSKFEDAYGPATAVPEFLRALSSPDPDDRKWAIDALDACIHHQGTVYSGSEAAVPFLIQLAENTEIENRELILKLLAGIAVHNPDACIIHGAFKWQSPAYKIICEGGDSFVKLLFDPDPKVITGAAFILCFLAPSPEGSMEALIEALEKSAESMSKSLILMAIGYVSRYQESNSERNRLACYLNDPSQAVQLGAVIGLTEMEGQNVGDDVRQILRELIDCESIDAEKYFFPWFDGDLPRIAHIILGSVTTDEQLLEDMGDENLPEEERKSAGFKCLYRMLRADRYRLHEMVLPSELNENQIKLLRWYIENLDNYDYEFFENQGLPDSLEQLNRFLGIEKGGCDQIIVIDSREMPVWFGIRETLEGRIGKEEIIDAIKKLDADAVYQLIDDAFYGPWKLQQRRGFYPYGEPEKEKVYDDYVDEAIKLMADIASSSGKAGLKWANHVAEKESAKVVKRDVYSGIAAAMVLGNNADKNKKELPEICDKLLELDQPPANTPLGALTCAYNYVPSQRRDKLLKDISLFYYTAYKDPKETVYRWNNNEKGWSFLVLMNQEKAAELVIDAWIEFVLHQQEKGNYKKNVRNKVESSLRQRIPENSNFPGRKAIDALACGGENIMKRLDALCKSPEIIDCRLFEDALNRMNF